MAPRTSAARCRIEEDTSDDLDDSHDLRARDVAAFSEENHRVYMAVQSRWYEEKQKKKQLKEEALRGREVISGVGTMHTARRNPRNRKRA